MTSLANVAVLPQHRRGLPGLAPLATLARRRLQLTARTPREPVAALLFAIGMYGVAETLANRVPKQEEYIARVPAVAILPWFLAGSLFPISALPSGLEWLARFLPLTHGLALMRYGLLDDSSGLHAIWRMHSPTAMAALSLAVVAVFATVLTAVAIRVFTRSAVR